MFNRAILIDGAIGPASAESYHQNFHFDRINNTWLSKRP